MNYQIGRQPGEGFIFKTGMIIADICATTVEKIFRDVLTCSTHYLSVCVPGPLASRLVTSPSKEGH